MICPGWKCYSQGWKSYSQGRNPIARERKSYIQERNPICRGEILYTGQGNLYTGEKSYIQGRNPIYRGEILYPGGEILHLCGEILHAGQINSICRGDKSYIQGGFRLSGGTQEGRRVLLPVLPAEQEGEEGEKKGGGGEKGGKRRKKRVKKGRKVEKRCGFLLDQLPEPAGQQAVLTLGCGRRGAAPCSPQFIPLSISNPNPAWRVIGGGGGEAKQNPLSRHWIWDRGDFPDMLAMVWGGCQPQWDRS